MHDRRGRGAGRQVYGQALSHRSQLQDRRRRQGAVEGSRWRAGRRWRTFCVRTNLCLDRQEVCAAITVRPSSSIQDGARSPPGNLQPPTQMTSPCPDHKQRAHGRRDGGGWGARARLHPVQQGGGGCRGQPEGLPGQPRVQGGRGRRPARGGAGLQQMKRIRQCLLYCFPASGAPAECCSVCNSGCRWRGVRRAGILRLPSFPKKRPRAEAPACGTPGTSPADTKASAMGCIDHTSVRSPNDIA